MERNELIIEELLSREYLYKLGAYVQTCAHIESSACSVICQIEGKDKNQPNYKERHHELRQMGTQKLITALRQASEKLPNDDQWKPILSDLSDWVQRFKDNRHLAIHGAHFENDGHITINAAPRQNREEFTSVSLDEIDEMVLDANRILSTLTRYWLPAARTAKQR